MNVAQRAWQGPGPGPGPGAVGAVPGVVYRRLLNGGGGSRVSPARTSPRVSPGRLSAAASLPLLLQDEESEEDAPSLSNILDAVAGLEVADDEGGEVAPRPAPTLRDSSRTGRG